MQNEFNLETLKDKYPEEYKDFLRFSQKLTEKEIADFVFFRSRGGTLCAKYTGDNSDIYQNWHYHTRCDNSGYWTHDTFSKKR